MADLSLKPCPFCGGPVALEQAHQRRHEHFGMRQLWGVVCRNTTNLGGTCCMEQVPSASPEAAVERWNRRSPADASGAVELTPLPPSRHKASDFEGWARVYTDHEVDNIRRAAVAADRRARGVPAVAGMSQQPAPAASIGDDFEFHRLLNHVCEASEELEAATGKLVFVAVDKLTSAKSALIAHIDAKLAEARRDGWGEGIAEAQELLADEIRSAARYSFIEQHATLHGGGHGFTITCFVGADEEDMGVGIDKMIAAAPAPDKEGSKQ